MRCPYQRKMQRRPGRNWSAFAAGMMHDVARKRRLSMRAKGAAENGATVGKKVAIEISMAPRLEDVGKILVTGAAVLSGKACFWQPPGPFEASEFLERRTSPLKRGR